MLKKMINMKLITIIIIIIILIQIDIKNGLLRSITSIIFVLPKIL